MFLHCNLTPILFPFYESGAISKRITFGPTVHYVVILLVTCWVSSGEMLLGQLSRWTRSELYTQISI